MTDLTQEQLQRIVELGKLATLPCGNPRNWDQLTLAWLKSAEGKHDAELLQLAANSAPVLAQRLLAIGKLCDKHQADGSLMMSVKSVRTVVEER